MPDDVLRREYVGRRVVGAAAGQMSSVGTCHQRFGRNTPVVGAGAADQLALDERTVWPVSVRRAAKNGPA